ncbi:hypothetical protein DCAR_0310587 [Daucus carota subsp. sativus]|uniref:Branchpoint-bridging protein n=1 Tax=Daucus carota subsp. sativus TaxID=79200 RepID=A0AAF0WMV7_DAUCS|nr:hypothetical protein DCAR_0310587 [Daucus carota subsp. sativus]
MCCCHGLALLVEGIVYVDSDNEEPEMDSVDDPEEEPEEDPEEDLLAKRNATISKELYVPVKEYPMYNFIGLILGPKGNTQKRMELKTGARIRLRGKDLSKSAQEADPSEDEDLNVYIEAVSQKSLDDAVCMVEKLLIPVEDEMNDHKRAQLQELWNLKAESCISSCSVCKEPGHNKFACPLKKTTLKAACEACGSFSHSTSGCPLPAPPLCLIV